ncbi:perlucin-like [Crassostrea virginica]
MDGDTYVHVLIPRLLVVQGEQLSWWWIGGSDFAVEGNWQWIAGGSVSSYNGWGPGQPDGNNTANCMSYRFFNHTQVAWADDVCAPQAHHGHHPPCRDSSARNHRPLLPLR